MKFFIENLPAIITCLISLTAFLTVRYRKSIFRKIGLSYNENDSKTKGWETKGNPDAWILIASATNKDLGVGHSTKALLHPKGALVHIKTVKDGETVGEHFENLDGVDQQWINREWKK